ncbi:RHS repeat-associated core domain-containing protein [Streptomyces mirabilis]|uniref:RHS repeat-associated core domain-containing protein n=1 Tax=Streptomyces mirabilis TaxID=68239 RepID=UPI0036AB8005
MDDTRTGLTHLGTREYDQSTGRFLSADPVIDPSDPLQINGYAYADNNPVTKSDPDGLQPIECWEGTAACHGGKIISAKPPKVVDLGLALAGRRVRHAPRPAAGPQDRRRDHPDHSRRGSREGTHRARCAVHAQVRRGREAR